MEDSVNLVREGEIDVFESQLKAFQNGDIFEEAFAASRLQLGVYGQRQSGKYMVRVKVPGGRLTRTQLQSLSSGLRLYSDEEFVNITTRQDIQFHFIPLENVAPLLRTLAESGLTTREACGNTVRNVTACSLAGVCPKENVNVLPFLDATVQHFLRHPIAQHLPRKFKISFSGCESDCAQGLIHDLAVIAVQQQGVNGFKILAGGGLGHKPREAVVVEEFIEPQYLIACVEAIINLHNRYSDRNKRAKSRIKFLVERFGESEFRDKYRTAFLRTKETLAPLSIDEQWETNQRDVKSDNLFNRITVQKQLSRSSVPLNIPLGDLNQKALNGLIEVMSKHELNEVRTTADQDLILVDVPNNRIRSLRNDLSAIGLETPETSSVVTCPGTWTCRLGITASRDAAQLLRKGEFSMNLRVSGCQNACARPHTSDIGLHGLAKRKFGKLIPYYQLHFGGNGNLGGQIGLKGPEIPSAWIREAIDRVQTSYSSDQSQDETFESWAQRKGTPFFTELLEDLTIVGPDDLSYLMKDHGAQDTFKVFALGGGECAGISEESMSAYVAEAANEQSYCESFLHQNMFESAIECCVNILRLTAMSLLNKQRIKFDDNIHHLGNRLAWTLTGQSKQVARFHEFLSLIERERKVTTKHRLTVLSNDLFEWHKDVINHLNGNLAMPSPHKALEISTNYIVDLSYQTSPSAFLKARKIIKDASATHNFSFRFSDDNHLNAIVQGFRNLGYNVSSMPDQKQTDSVIVKVLTKVSHTTEENLAVH